MQPELEPSNHTIASNEESDNKQLLIDDDKFLLLKACQQQIRKSIEFSPAIRKLVNELITVENLQKLTDKYIKFFEQFNMK